MSFTSAGTGGEYKHQLNYYEMPNHVHVEYAMVEGYPEWNTFTPSAYSMLFGWQRGDYRGNVTTYHAAKTPLNTTTSDEGGSQSHNNIQPYIVVYFWRRTK